MDDDPFFRDPNPDCYEETRDNLRDFIFGDRWLMGYCLEVAALAAIEKGEDACWDLLDNCNCELLEGLKVDCVNNPKAMIEELLRLTDP